jgi:CYTH domain-containing protein
MPSPKYSLLENERRFLVIAPPNLTGARVRLIEDRYLSCGRLRLRRITHFDGHLPEFKLCKKYGSDDPFSEPITNIYLSEAEHAALSALAAHPLRKRRHTVRWGERGFSVDVFEGPLTGLVTCEAEAESPEAIRARAFPPWAAREVTTDPRFSGAHLATLAAEDLAAQLALA